MLHRIAVAGCTALTGGSYRQVENRSDTSKEQRDDTRHKLSRQLEEGLCVDRHFPSLPAHGASPLFGYHFDYPGAVREVAKS
jgi:hypothetical protein